MAVRQHPESSCSMSATSRRRDAESAKTDRHLDDGDVARRIRNVSLPTMTTRAREFRHLIRQRGLLRTSASIARQQHAIVLPDTSTIGQACTTTYLICDSCVTGSIAERSVPDDELVTGTAEQSFGPSHLRGILIPSPAPSRTTPHRGHLGQSGRVAGEATGSVGATERSHAGDVLGDVRRPGDESEERGLSNRLGSARRNPCVTDGTLSRPYVGWRCRRSYESQNIK